MLGSDYTVFMFQGGHYVRLGDDGSLHQALQE